VANGKAELTLEQLRALEGCAVISWGYEESGCQACGALAGQYKYNKRTLKAEPIPQVHKKDCWLAAAIREAERVEKEANDGK